MGQYMNQFYGVLNAWKAMTVLLTISLDLTHSLCRNSGVCGLGFGRNIFDSRCREWYEPYVSWGHNSAGHPGVNRCLFKTTLNISTPGALTIYGQVFVRTIQLSKSLNVLFVTNNDSVYGLGHNIGVDFTANYTRITRT